MALKIFRDVYASDGRTVVPDVRFLLIVYNKIGSIGFAGTSLSSKLASMPGYCSFADFLIALGDGIGRHRWSIPLKAFTAGLLRVRSSRHSRQLGTANDHYLETRGP